MNVGRLLLKAFLVGVAHEAGRYVVKLGTEANIAALQERLRLRAEWKKISNHLLDHENYAINEILDQLDSVKRLILTRQILSLNFGPIYSRKDDRIAMILEITNFFKRRSLYGSGDAQDYEAEEIERLLIGYDG